MERLQAYGRRELVYVALGAMDICVVTPLLVALFFQSTPIRPFPITAAFLASRGLRSSHHARDQHPRQEDPRDARKHHRGHLVLPLLLPHLLPFPQPLPPLPLALPLPLPTHPPRLPPSPCLPLPPLWLFCPLHPLWLLRFWSLSTPKSGPPRSPTSIAIG